MTAGPCTFRGRQGFRLDNGVLQVTMLSGGGHVADMHRGTDGVNPLWVPQWPTLEPSEYDPAVHGSAYGGPAAGRLLASIMGHNVCLDFFGDPSPEELARGITVHGEAPTGAWEILGRVNGLTGTVDLPHAGLRLERRLDLAPGSGILHITETVTNMNDRPHEFGWCQHVTLGAPFLQKGVTRCDMPAVWGQTFGADFGSALRLAPDTEFTWPQGPGADGNPVDMRMAPAEPVSGDFSAQLMDPALDQAWFTACNPEMGLLFGYVWDRTDFPWIGNWEENYAREARPWAGREYCRGMEFSTSPFPAGKAAAVAPGRLRGIPTFRSLPAGGRAEVRYAAFIQDGLTGFAGADRLMFDGQTVTVRGGTDRIVIE